MGSVHQVLFVIVPDLKALRRDPCLGAKVHKRVTTGENQSPRVSSKIKS